MSADHCQSALWKCRHSIAQARGPVCTIFIFYRYLANRSYFGEQCWKFANRSAEKLFPILLCIILRTCINNYIHSFLTFSLIRSYYNKKEEYCSVFAGSVYVWIWDSDEEKLNKFVIKISSVINYKKTTYNNTYYHHFFYFIFKRIFYN